MKNDLPYFSHNNNARRHPKMKALIAEFGFEGYGRFWALCERIAEDSDAYLDISKKVNKLDLASELNMDGSGLDDFLSFLADPEIDLINMDNDVVTVDRITELFEQTAKSREGARLRKAGKKGKGKGSDKPCESSEGKGESSGEPDKKEEKKREEKTKVNSCGSDEPPFFEPPLSKTADLLGPPFFEAPPPPTPDEKPPERAKAVGRPKKPPLREREPENGHERVEKAYLENWDRLRAEGKVQTREPIVNWGQTRKLLSARFAWLPPDKIVEAINNGLKNDFVMRGGYSLATMLSASTLNGLLNSTGPPSGRGNSPPPNLAGKSLAGLKNRPRGDPDEPFGEGG